MTTKIDILSIDWDFFFPCTDEYDWGHREEGLFLEFLWQVRCSNTSLLTKKPALTNVQPNAEDLKKFWSTVIKQKRFVGVPLVIAESHKDIQWAIDLAKQIAPEIAIYNFDAHHDIHYGQTEELGCDNWVWFNRQDIKEYHLIYPKWRQENKEIETDYQPASITYGLENFTPPEYGFDIVFICRSGAWTPSWCDDKWIDFISFWKAASPETWRNQATCSLAHKVRYPNMEQALEIKKEMDQMVNELLKSEVSK